MNSPVLTAPPRGRPVHPAGETTKASSRVLRLVLAIVALLSFVVGVIAFTAGADGLRLVCLMVFMVFGVGAAPWQGNARLGTYERLTLVFVTAAGVLTLGALFMLQTGFWHPGLAFFAVAAVTLPGHVRGLFQVMDETEAYQAPAWPSRYLPVARTREAARALWLSDLPATGTATVGLVLCLGSALRHQHLDPGYFGFLAVIGPWWYLGLALILLGVVLRGRSELSRALPVFFLVLVLTLTPGLTYDLPRSQSAAKHVDFVIQIQKAHVLNSSVAVYNAFAGFFAAMAWLCDVVGIKDPMRLAALWPALLGVFRVVVLRYLAGQALSRSALAWVAVTLAVLADSIGADYFSPQSIGFVLGMAAVAIALSRNPSLPRLPLLLFAGVTLAVSHQLSPYVAGGALLVLVVFRVVRPWWTPALVLGPAIAWTALNWDAVKGFISLDAFGHLGNFTPPKTVGAPSLDRLPIVRETVIALLVGILVLIALAAVSLVRNRRDSRYWAYGCCSGVGLVIIAANPYGQEGIFRAALFGLPWLAIMGAGVVAGERWRSRLALLAITSVMAGAFLVSSFGLDALNVIRPSDLAAVRAFQRDGGPRPPNPYYLLLLNTGDQPTSPSVGGSGHFIWGRDVIEDPVRQQRRFVANRKVRELTRRFVTYSTTDSNGKAHLFALWSPVGQQYGRAYAIQTLGQSAALRDAFRRSPYWTVLSSSDGTYLFRFDRARYAQKPS